MYHFQYVTKAELKPFKKRVIELIHLVQDDVRNDFTFQYEFVGSVSRNMVTCDYKSNVGFDFDINIMVNDEDNEYSASEIKHILMDAFNKHARKYKYDYCEDSTRVFTRKVKDTRNSRILHSCDFAIVKNYGDNQQQYIRFHKPEYYSWEEQPDGYYQLPLKIEFCKDHGLWLDVRNLYLQKKNQNTDPAKKSRSIFAETIHQVCQRNGYYAPVPGSQPLYALDFQSPYDQTVASLYLNQGFQKQDKSFQGICTTWWD